MFDTVVRGDERDIGIENGLIAAIGPDLPSGKAEIDARGLTVLPGLIDVHLHFNEPGRTDWEGAATGSAEFLALHHRGSRVRSEVRRAPRFFDYGFRSLGRHRAGKS
jgi:imidazolonepropionase-like amidohydrolase